MNTSIYFVVNRSSVTDSRQHLSDMLDKFTSKRFSWNCKAKQFQDVPLVQLSICIEQFLAHINMNVGEWFQTHMHLDAYFSVHVTVTSSDNVRFNDEREMEVNGNGCYNIECSIPFNSVVNNLVDGWERAGGNRKIERFIANIRQALIMFHSRYTHKDPEDTVVVVKVGVHGTPIIPTECKKHPLVECCI